MAQTVRPISDVSFTGVTYPTAGVGAYSTLNETSPSNASGVTLNHFGVVETVRVRLGAASVPGIKTGHTIFFSAFKSPSAGNNVVRLQAQLLTAGGTVIGGTAQTLTASLADYSYTLDPIFEAAHLVPTDYPNLDLLFTPTTSTFQVTLYYAAFSLPSAGFVHLTPQSSGPGYAVAAANSGTFMTLTGPGFKTQSGVEDVGSVEDLRSFFKIH